MLNDPDLPFYKEDHNLFSPSRQPERRLTRFEWNRFTRVSLIP